MQINSIKINSSAKLLQNKCKTHIFEYLFLISNFTTNNNKEKYWWGFLPFVGRLKNNLINACTVTAHSIYLNHQDEMARSKVLVNLNIT